MTKSLVFFVAAMTASAGAISLTSKDLAKLRRGDLVGRHFDITIVETAPFVMPIDGDYFCDGLHCVLPSGSAFQGLVPSMIYEMSLRAGFTYTLHTASGHGSGCSPGQEALSSNYGCAQKDVTELGATHMYWGDFYATPARANASLFSQPFLASTGPALITMQESEDLFKSMGVIGRPFQSSQWFVMLLLTVFASFTMWYLEDGTSGVDGRLTFDSLRASCMRSFWLSVATMTGADAHHPEHGSGLWFSLFWGV